MKRTRIVLVSAVMAVAVLGCDSGLKQGMPEDTAAPTQPAGLQAEMEKNAKNMGMMKQGRPPNAPK